MLVVGIAVTMGIVTDDQEVRKKERESEMSSDEELRLWGGVLDPSHVQRVVDKLAKRAVSEWPERDVRSAAVLVPLLTTDGEGEPSVLFTLRSRELSHHRHQVCFPGGVAEPGDATPTDTALRETEEELGISPQEVAVWGSMHSFPAKDNTHITPVIGHIRGFEMSRLRPNRQEVEKVFTVPLSRLASIRHQGYTQFQFGTSTYRTPVFAGGPFRIWGFTALVLDMVLLKIVPRGLKYVPIMSRTFSTLVR